MDGFGDEDPAAEFLAREQNDLAGLEDDLKPVNEPISLDGFDAPGDISPPNGGFEVVNDDIGAFSSETKEVNVTVVDNNDFFNDVPAEPEPAPIPQVKQPREEPEKIRIWREEQKKRLEEKDKNEAKKIEEWKEAAKKELEEWYRHHEELVAKTKAANRNSEKEQVAAEEEPVPGTEWERIAKLCDFNPKATKGSKDMSRMRSIILQLKQNPLPTKTA